MSFPLIKKIKAEIPTLNEVPLFGNTPRFDWSRFSSLIASRFGLSVLSVRAETSGWKEPEDFSETGGLTLAFSIEPMEGHVFWIMSREDIARLTSWMLTGKSKGRSVTAELLQEGFYRYLLLEALDCLQDMQPLDAVTLRLNEEAVLPQETAFCVDVEISFDEKTCWGRLVIPSSFRNCWVSHFSVSTGEHISIETARATELVLGVQTGSVVLSQKEWASIEPGDFVQLDKSGFAHLTLGQTPLFQVKIYPNKLELTDYAFYSEAKMKTPSEEEVKAIKELPLTVVAEVARLKISLEKLMQLQPGNTLDLGVHPGQGVNLTVNGQCVGRAELVQLGDVLGLRILEIG